MEEDGEINVKPTLKAGIFEAPNRRRQEVLGEIQGLRDSLSSGFLSREQYEQQLLTMLGLSRTQEGKVRGLYHATTFENLSKIMADKCVLPSLETGNRVWRTRFEDYSQDGDNLEKKQKVYLAARDGITQIAKNIQNEYGHGVYIIEVEVNENDLAPDEDSHESNWIDSLGWYQLSCSHRGRIGDFNVVARLDPILDSKSRVEYIRKAIAAREAGDKILESDTFKEFQKAKDELIIGEDQKLEEMGISPASITTIKLE